ncbi:hypothetical protein DFH07DRAFT_943248 [Mycena maculata]|uniref:Uncharacterized protein n=1 Tax=Mycena maculata TaxID=230809 RepID=A0AAD7IHT7_9AGAR|nr:hypothetical protein DFH07DRAFT_943248 [Mycena maculata]
MASSSSPSKLIAVPSSPQSTPGRTPLLNRSLADYQHASDLSHPLASSLRHAEEKVDRVDLLETTLQSLSSSSGKELSGLEVVGNITRCRQSRRRPRTRRQRHTSPGYLPDHAPEYVRALLCYATPEQVVASLLEGTALSLEELQRSASAPPDEITSYVRRNVESVDLAHVRVGKKTRKKFPMTKRTGMDAVHDHVKVAGDGEESGGEDSDAGLSPEMVCELAYIRDPKVFERDAQTRRRKARADLKAQMAA